MSRKLTKEQFIQRAKIIHGDNYDYECVVYVNTDVKVKIFCKNGSHYMYQTPHNHLMGCSCLECENKRRASKFEIFERKAIVLHSNKYEYPDKTYVNAETKIKILCKSCNDIFYQTPHSHLLPRGCPKCARTKVDMISKKETAWLNKINIPAGQRNIYIEGELFHNNRINVDGYDPLSNTIYLFHGDYWHGNPRKFNPIEINKRVNITFGELYRKTIEKEDILKTMGFTVVSMWEYDWDLLASNV